jgi:hypothetical protein
VPTLCRVRATSGGCFELCGALARISTGKEKARKAKLCKALRALENGGRGIRTPVPVRVNGFQDRRLKPLGHPSSVDCIFVQVRALVKSGYHLVPIQIHNESSGHQGRVNLKCIERVNQVSTSSANIKIFRNGMVDLGKAMGQSGNCWVFFQL